MVVNMVVNRSDKCFLMLRTYIYGVLKQMQVSQTIVHTIPSYFSPLVKTRDTFAGTLPSYKCPSSRLDIFMHSIIDVKIQWMFISFIQLKFKRNCFF